MGKTQQTHLEQLEKQSDPTRFRLEVFDHEAKTNPDGVYNGRGCGTRPSYDFLQYQEHFESNTYLDGHDEVEPMTKTEYFLLMKTKKGWTDVECQDEWDKTEASKAKRYYNEKNELVLHCFIRRVFLVGKRIQQANVVSGSMKPLKSPKVADVEAMRANLLSRHEALDSDLYKPLGGAEFAATPGTSSASQFSGQAPILLKACKGKGVKRERDDQNDEADGAQQPPQKQQAKPMRDRESKLNKLRNDATDLVDEAQKVALKTIGEESEQLSFLSEQEKTQADYAALLITYQNRMLALKILCGQVADTKEDWKRLGVWSETPVVDAGSNLVAEADLNKSPVETKKILKALQEALTKNNKPAPTASFSKAFPMVDLYEKVSFLGEQVTTADELRAAKKAFASVVDATTDVAAAARQSAQDIRSRKTNKQSKATKEETKAKDALVREAKIAESKAKAVSKSLAQQKERTGRCQEGCGGRERGRDCRFRVDGL